MDTKESNGNSNGSKKRRPDREEFDGQSKELGPRPSRSEGGNEPFGDYEEEYGDGGFGSWSFRTSFGFPNFRKRNKRPLRRC